MPTSDLYPNVQVDGVDVIEETSVLNFVGTDFDIDDGGDPLDGKATISIATGAGLTPTSHRDLDQLVHNIAENSFTEYVRSGNRITDLIIWETSSKIKKIREENYTYLNNRISTIVIKQYDGTGTLITGETLTNTYNYTGGQVVSIDSVLS